MFAFWLLLSSSLSAQTGTPVSRAQEATEKIIIDTDIGDEYDDAFAVGLALRSPEVRDPGNFQRVGGTPISGLVC